MQLGQPYTRVLHNDLPFSHLKKICIICFSFARCCQPSWEQFRVTCLARGHYKLLGDRRMCGADPSVTGQPTLRHSLPNELCIKSRLRFQTSNQKQICTTGKFFFNVAVLVGRRAANQWLIYLTCIWHFVLLNSSSFWCTFCTTINVLINIAAKNVVSSIVKTFWFCINAKINL